MTREEVWKRVEASLREGFGRLLDVRDVRRVRRVAGDAWTVTVVLAAPSGDLHVADVSVDDAGTITPTLTGDDVVAAARRAKAATSLAPPPDELADFGDGPTSDSDPALAMLSEGIDVREVGPMVEPPEGKIIDAAAIRALRDTRKAA